MQLRDALPKGVHFLWFMSCLFYVIYQGLALRAEIEQYKWHPANDDEFPRGV